MNNTPAQMLKFQFESDGIPMDISTVDFFKQKAPVKEDNANTTPPIVKWHALTLREVTGLKWLVVIPWAGIVEFKGESIPGILTVDSCYTPPEGLVPKRGRVWEVKVSSLGGHPTALIHCSEHFSALSKQGWVAEFREVLKGWRIPGDELSDERILKALVTIFQDHAVKINEYQKDKGDTLYDLLREQEQLSHALLLDFPFLVEG